MADFHEAKRLTKDGPRRYVRSEGLAQSIRLQNQTESMEIVEQKAKNLAPNTLLFASYSRRVDALIIAPDSTAGKNRLSETPKVR